MRCSALDLAHFLGGKWTIVILEEIALGRFDGFNNFLKKSGVTPKILSGELKGMEDMGLIKKSSPIKSKYAMTEKGSEFRGIITHIKKFNEKWSGGEKNCTEKSCISCGRFK